MDRRDGSHKLDAAGNVELSMLGLQEIAAADDD